MTDDSHTKKCANGAGGLGPGARALVVSLLLALLGVVVVIATAPSQAYSGGITGTAGSGCTCHSGGTAPGITLYNVYNRWSCATYPCQSTSDGPNYIYYYQNAQAYTGGNVWTGNGGSYVGGTLSGYTTYTTLDTYASGGEVTHNGRIDDRYFRFYWDPPSTPGYYAISGYIDSVNGNATYTGDNYAYSGIQYIAVCKDDDGDGYVGTGSNPGVCPTANDCNDSNSAANPGGTESCGNYGTDNDCDNRSDELTNGVYYGDSCTTGNYGICAAGYKACSGGVVTCFQSNSAVSETCSNTGTDDDCDNDATELTNGVHSGDACSTGNYGVCAAGTRACSGSTLVCNQTTAAGTETCSNTGTDNDCDNDATELTNGVHAGDACTTGLSGICSPGTRGCSAGSLVCNQTVAAGTESCSNQGVDDDCDGNSAELANGITAATACSVLGAYGVCAASTYTCSGGALVCPQTVSAGTETCSNTGTDNDCDNDATELTNGVHSGDACSTGLQGVCAAGTRACSGSTLVCNQTTSSSTEICDNLDNNCNGTVDEGCDDDNDDYCEAGMTKAAVVVSVCPNSGASAAGNDCDDTCVTCVPGGTEICDGKDNNCNGSSDDNIAATTCGFGVCQVTQGSCVAGVPQGCTPNTGASTSETCSNTGVDNDCDGNALELNNNVFAGDACSTGLQGVCSAGTRACSGSALICSQTTTASAESCTNTGIDNDCDGDATEIAPGIHAGDACTVGGAQGICTAGTYACSAGTLTCVQTYAPGTVAETCLNSGVDNDCDGDATELTNGVHSGDVCTTGQPGICSAGKQQCSSGALSCVADNTAKTESCDNLDNDCDGTSDDGIALATCGVGACANTGATCFAASCTPKASSAEICDGIDNDCDNSTDEGCDDDNDDYCDASMTTQGLPPTCQQGGNDCDDTAAASNPGASEVCDNKDNDCDGDTDENIPILTCGVGECASTATACVGGVGQSCTPKPSASETCDGKDNDCDGTIDNGIPLATCGIGECFKTGATCNPQSCDANVGASPEVCDDKDNDCDGTSDDGVPLSTCGQGICARTGTTCHPESCTPGQASLEVCDGVDNDCNGTPDDGLPLAKCGVGACAAVGTSCLPSSCVPLGSGSEVCDNADNDCDGKIDEGCDDDGDGYCDASLTFTVSGACPNGAGDCDDELADSHPGAPELCDGADNDCDTTPDDGITEVICGIGACKATGTACNAGVAEDCSPLSPAETDVCDGVDNDCDGRIDNGKNGAGIPDQICGEGACQVKVLGCVAGTVPACTPLPASDEVCDGFDNDCNGDVDEGKLCEGGFCVSGKCIYPDYSAGGASGVPSGTGGKESSITNTAGAASMDAIGGQGGQNGNGDGAGAPSGCGCEQVGQPGSAREAAVLLLVLGVTILRRRRAA